MTDDQNTTETTEASTGEKPTNNGEAAKYRRQLREAEAERDALRNQLTAARTELVRTAVTGFKVGKATFKDEAFKDAEIDTDTMFGEDGNLNADALNAHMTTLHENRGYMFAQPDRLIIPNEGRSPANDAAASSFADAFKP